MAAVLANAKDCLTNTDVPSSGDEFVVLVAGGIADCGAATACAAEGYVPNLEMRCSVSGNCVTRRRRSVSTPRPLPRRRSASRASRPATPTAVNPTIKLLDFYRSRYAVSKPGDFPGWR